MMLTYTTQNPNWILEKNDKDKDSGPGTKKFASSVLQKNKQLIYRQKSLKKKWKVMAEYLENCL